MASKLIKYFIYCVIISVFVSVFLILCNLDYYNNKWNFNNLHTVSNLPLDFKYILIWTSPNSDPIKYFGVGQTSFVNKKCSITNCYVTANKALLANADIILFHGPELENDPSQLPQYRFPDQKYVFASMESSEYYPVCNDLYNRYFNWTWTYKLKSDGYFGYIIIRDKQGKIIGPKEEMHWEKSEVMQHINDTIKAKLSTKKYAAAWFVSNCAALSGRFLIVKKLQNELAKYNLTVDIFGKCGTKKCPMGSMVDCLRQVERDYYFYLSFENSFTEDYVTEKLLHALKHYAVPVVYGGANYTRFMSDGMYLVARRQSIGKLAREMVNIMHDKHKYYSFFKWHNHYSYHSAVESPETDSYCKLCAAINDHEYSNRISVYNDFVNWWSPPNKCY